MFIKTVHSQYFSLRDAKSSYVLIYTLLLFSFLFPFLFLFHNPRVLWVQIDPPPPFKLFSLTKMFLIN